MITKYQTVGITYDESKIKLAAILFDKVYCPLNNIYIPEDLIIPFRLKKDDIDFVSDSLAVDTNSIQILKEKYIDPFVNEDSIVEKSRVVDAMHKTREETKNQFFNALILEVSHQITKNNTLGIPLVNDSILNYNFRQCSAVNELFDKVEVEIINNPVIDCSNLDWKHIVEVKQDPDFTQKVKRFSVFVNRNYTGKDLSFITDDLNIQLDDYKRVCKKHGIKFTFETVKTLSNSKSLFGTFAVSLLSMLAHMPQYAIATGTVGAALELVNLKINLKQYKDQHEASIKNSPIALIYDIEKMQKVR